jgi:hypothetical protein
MLDPQELQRRFGSQPIRFYAYNVAASVSSVLFTEPQDGVFETVYSWLHRQPMWRVALPVATSVLTTGLLLWSAARRLRHTRMFDDGARTMVVFAAVLAANATLSFAYTKDEIMSVAGAFYALAAYAAVRDAVSRGASLRPAPSMVCALLLCALATGWSIRAVGVHYVLRSQAVKHQIDWVELPERWKRDGNWPSDPAEQQLILLLRDDAIASTLPNTRLGRPEWPDRLWLE